jgi:signal transduction histidine kinase
VPSVSADPARLDHLFVNLGLNAIQAMPKNGSLVFSATADEDGVLISVTDSGPGMTSEKIAGLFQPFRTTRPGGFGLGLFSCRQIARECGGDLQVESEIGTGTRFVIRLRKMNS